MLTPAAHEQAARGRTPAPVYFGSPRVDFTQSDAPARTVTRFDCDRTETQESEASDRRARAYSAATQAYAETLGEMAAASSQ